MALDDADPAVCTFLSLGVMNLSTADFVAGALRSILAPIGSFLCKVYAPKNNNITAIPKLRWELYRLKNFEGEKLPPTLATFYPHMMIVNFVSKRNKSYLQCHPNLLPLNRSGWKTHDEAYLPIKSRVGSAPKEVMELAKGSCEKGCKEGKCSCV